MQTKYRVKVPIRAILDMPEAGEASVKLPEGALLKLSQTSLTPMRRVGVYWEGRHYSIHLSDLLRKTERVESA
jgi:hypothetical protein